jgi:uncharacterized protein YndB with AHSA1/START domain
MDHDVRINKFFSTDSETLFQYFIDSELIQKWAYPDGMSLKVTKYEALEGGKYHFEHSGKDGVYICTGFVKEFIPEKKIVQVDEKIIAPDGDKLFENLESIVEFSPQFGGTEVSLIHSGFSSQEAANECHIGWTQSLNHLTRLISQKKNIHDGEIGREASM